MLPPPRNLTPHCTRYCWLSEWHNRDVHYHANAKRKRFVRRHRRMQPYERSHIGAREVE